MKLEEAETFPVKGRSSVTEEPRRDGWDLHHKEQHARAANRSNKGEGSENGFRELGSREWGLSGGGCCLQKSTRMGERFQVLLWDPGPPQIFHSLSILINTEINY